MEIWTYSPRSIVPLLYNFSYPVMDLHFYTEGSKNFYTRKLPVFIYKAYIYFMQSLIQLVPNNWLAVWLVHWNMNRDHCMQQYAAGSSPSLMEILTYDTRSMEPLLYNLSYLVMLKSLAQTPHFFCRPCTFTPRAPPTSRLGSKFWEIFFAISLPSLQGESPDN